MRKYLVTGILLSLTVLLLLTQVPAVRGEDISVPSDGTIFNGNCEGMPLYTIGEDVGVFISCSPDRTSWSVRWNGDKLKHDFFQSRGYIFTGDIRATQITDVVEIEFEESNPDEIILIDGVNNNILTFIGFVSGRQDGVDFTVAGEKVVFAFDGNLINGAGSYTLTEADIFIGADGEHPRSVNFRIMIP